MLTWKSTATDDLVTTDDLVSISVANLLVSLTAGGGYMRASDSS
jgi:hypothetical protein